MNDEEKEVMDNKRALYNHIYQEIKDRQALEWKIVAGVTAIFAAVVGWVVNIELATMSSVVIFWVSAIFIFVVSVGSMLMLNKNQGIAHQNADARYELEEGLKLTEFNKIFLYKPRITWRQKFWATGWFLSYIIIIGLLSQFIISKKTKFMNNWTLGWVLVGLFIIAVYFFVWKRCYYNYEKIKI